MLKHELRKKYKNLRLGMSPEEISASSIILANHVLEIPIWDFFYFHTFLSIQTNQEVDTLPLITLLQGRDKNVVVPKVVSNNSMENFLLTDSTRLKLSKWSIPEPEDGIPIPESKIDVVFVPLLAFDLKGNRVGYGKGYYDNFLRKCDDSTVKIGMSLFAAENSIQGVHENDVALDYCITPKKIYEF
ncbi:5-formyltetrahydrofolate cyclo-ligase [Flagellimonas algicola]|uniref:5-formyltetrahydrofolate cyclo-ligase n=1 Tax=Flagellimonas algicola TaxID=2583815 RepID=A0ABY2WKQ0_9FLAO|nr:5-formyltetrahydrofolate cyclo-ligase [Allomuricauda algicola]TMU55308.1 5-formyltetrahydrofolate cyclo-ligase [Allomuricauda algicola]